jgi:hypothetical protein
MTVTEVLLDSFARLADRRNGTSNEGVAAALYQNIISGLFSVAYGAMLEGDLPFIIGMRGILGHSV